MTPYNIVTHSTLAMVKQSFNNHTFYLAIIKLKRSMLELKMLMMVIMAMINEL